METRCWIGAVSAENGQKRGICAFSHGKKETVSNLLVGGRFALIENTMRNA